jgi:hypothetical protein
VRVVVEVGFHGIGVSDTRLLALGIGIERIQEEQRERERERERERDGDRRQLNDLRINFVT